MEYTYIFHGMYVSTHTTHMFKNIKNAIQSHSRTQFENICLKPLYPQLIIVILEIYLNETVVG